MSLVLLVALVLFVVAQESGLPNPFSPREDLCAQGKALNSGRLLDAARDIYDGAGDCDPPGLERVERAQAEADERFAEAGIYATASGIDPQAPSPANSKLAIERYRLGLERDPFDADANVALKLELDKGAIDPKQECEVATALADAGLLSDAGAALANSLKAGGRCDAALAKVSEERQAAAGLQAEALDLERSGQITKARTRYAQALRANANLDAAKSGLEASIVDETGIDAAESWLAGIPDTLKAWLDWLIPLAIGLLLLALGIWIVVREWSARFAPARKAFEWLGGHAGLSFFHKAAVPDVSIEPFEGKGEGDLEGAAFSTMLTAALGEQVGREPSFPLDRVGGTRAPETSDVATAADLLAEFPATKLVGGVFKLIGKLFRRRSIVIGGRLAPKSDQGAGVLVSLEGNGRELADSVTLWERGYDPKPGGEGAARWLRLVPAATIWTRWHLAAAHSRPSPLDTESWEAEALLQAGRAWHNGGEPARAEALYVRALESDPTLLPAVHGLARIENGKGAYALAARRLERLRATLAAGRPDPVCGKPPAEIWPLLDTASLYTLVLALAYPTIDETDSAGEGDLDLAIEKGQLLVSQLASAASGHSGGADPLVRAQLTSAEAPSVVVLAALRVRQSSAIRADAITRAIDRGEAVAEVSREQLRFPAGLNPWDLIHGYVEREQNVSRRAHYNLACYYTTLAGYATGYRADECFKLALAALEAGLVGGEFTRWAKEDPSLRPLQAEGRKEKFDRIIKAHTIEAHADAEKAGETKPADPKHDSSLAEKLKKAFEDWLDPAG